MTTKVQNIHENSGHDHSQGNLVDFFSHHNIDFNDKDHMKEYINTYKENHHNHYLEALKNLKPGEKYTDPEFPPTLASLTKDVSKFKKCKDFVWRRYKAIFNSLGLRNFPKKGKFN